MLEPYPTAGDFAADASADAEIEWVKQFIVGIRQIRGEMNLSRGLPLAVRLQGFTDLDRERVARNRLFIDRLAAITAIDWLEPDAKAPGSATALVGQMRILIPLAGLIDVDKEIDRLEKQLVKIDKDLALTGRKLGNAQFVANAPAEIVAKERERAAELAARRAQFDRQLLTLREIA